MKHADYNYNEPATSNDSIQIQAKVHRDQRKSFIDILSSEMQYKSESSQKSGTEKEESGEMKPNIPESITRLCNSHKLIGSKDESKKLLLYVSLDV